MKNFKIVNGRWTINNEKLNPLEAVQFESVLIKVRFFAGDKKLSHDKIELLTSVLNTNTAEDNRMINALYNNEPLN